MAQPYPDDAVTTMGPDMNEATTEVIAENREMRRRRQQRERTAAKFNARLHKSVTQPRIMSLGDALAHIRGES